MIECKRCGSTETVKNGMVRGTQRYLCKQCGYHFVYGDQRENKDSHFLKTLCKLFQALGIKNYRTIGQYMNRDTSLIHRWMNEESFKHKCRYDDFSTECYNAYKLFEELEKGGVKKSENPLFIADNVIDGLYVAVIVQRRKKR